MDVDGRGADTQFRVEVYVNGDNVGGGIISRDNVTLFGEVPAGSIVPNAQRQQINLRSNNPNNGHYGVSENYNLTVHMGEHQRQTCGSPNQFASMQLANYCPASVTSALYPNWRLFNPTSEYKPDDIILDIEVDYDAIETLANGNILYDVNITLTNNTQDNYGETAVPSVVVSDLITVNGNPVDLESIVIDESAGWVVSNEESPVESILDSDTGVIQFEIPSIDNDTSGQLIFQIELPPGMITNHDIQITSVNQQIPPVGDQNYASATIIVPTQADLELNVSGLQENEYIAGTIYTPVITVNNSGPEIAKDIQVTIQLSQGMQITDNPLPDDLAASEFSVGRYVWSIDELAVSTSAELQFKTTLDFSMVEPTNIRTIDDFQIWISSSDSYDFNSQPTVQFPDQPLPITAFQTTVHSKNIPDCGVITANGSVQLRNKAGTDSTPIGRTAGNSHLKFTPIAITQATGEDWLLIDYHPYEEPFNYNGAIYDGARVWILKSLTSVANCGQGPVIPNLDGQNVEIDVRRERTDGEIFDPSNIIVPNALPVASGIDSIAPDPAKMWAPIGSCPPNGSRGYTFAEIRERCAYENYVRLWNDIHPDSGPMKTIDLLSIGILNELNSEVFSGVRPETLNIDTFNDLNTKEQYIVEAAARNFAEICGSEANMVDEYSTVEISCNVLGAVRWSANLKKLKDNSNVPIESLYITGDDGFGGRSYEFYNSKLTLFVFSDADYTSGAEGNGPSNWGNQLYKYTNSDGNLITLDNNVVISTINQEVANRDPARVTVVSSSLNSREIVVVQGQQPLPRESNGFIFVAKEDGSDPEICVYTFTIQFSGSSAGTLGTCGP